MNPADLDERQLVRALTDVLQQQRQTLAAGGPEGAAVVGPIWQPLIDALDRYAEQRRAGQAAGDGASAATAAEVGALRDEAQALQHTLTVWTAALQQALGQSARQHAATTYGPGTAALSSGPRPRLGRG